MAVHIERVETLNLYFTNEANRGVDASLLQDIGIVNSDAPTEVISPEEADRPTHQPEDIEVTTGTPSIAPAPVSTSNNRVKPYTRRAELYKYIKYAGKMRRLRGGVTTTQETQIEDMDSAVDAHEGYNELLKTTLAKACAKCALRDSCSLVENSEAWLRRHPTDKKQVTNRLQEAIPDFIARLDKDPMAHCVPPGKRR